MVMNMRVKTKQLNQSGLVSFTVVMIIMLLATLIVSSFALVVRREQQRALDRQLSSQAFYAAEVGVGDAITALTQNPDTTSRQPLTDDVTDCSGPQSFITKTSALGANFNQDLGDNMEYSCVLIDRDPVKWQIKDALPETGPFVVPINTSSTVSYLDISWKAKDDKTNFSTSANYDLPNKDAPGLDTPLLRVTLMPGINGSLTAPQLEQGAHTMFLYPQGNSVPNNRSTVAYRGGAGFTQTDPAQGQFVSGQCNVNSVPAFENYCNVRISNLALQKYYLVIQPLYGAAAIDVTARDVGDTPLPLLNAQAVIDVTGKSSDVLRRIQVRVPIAEGLRTMNFSSLLPPGALVTNEKICKLLERTNTQVVDNCDNPTPTPITDPGPTAGGGAFFTNPPASTGTTTNPGTGIPNLEFDFRTYHINASGNADSVVSGCRWDWGDGTYSLAPPGSSLTTLQNNGCFDRWSVRHVFPVTVSSFADFENGDCRTYRVTLTVYFNNGWPDKNYTALRSAPYGTTGGTNAGCRDDPNVANAPSGPDIVWTYVAPIPATTQCQIDQPPCYQRRYAPATP